VEGGSSALKNIDFVFAFFDGGIFTVVAGNSFTFHCFFVRSTTLHPQYAQLCVVCQSIGTLPVSYISARLYFYRTFRR